MQTEPKMFSYEWFCSLTDEELSDIGFMEASVEKSTAYLENRKESISDLLAALAKRIQEKNND